MALSVARRLQISEKTQAMRAERFTQLCIRTSPTDTNGPTRPSLAANPALTFYLDHSVGADQLARGLAANHPATAVFDATRATETVITATLATLPNRLEQADTNAPCVVLIGEGVAKPAYLDAASRQKRKEKCRA